MKLVKQISPTTCGQACVAMIGGISIEEAINLVGHSSIVSDKTMANCQRGEPFRMGAPDVGAIAVCKHCEPGGFRAHWTVWFRGQILDPACIQRGMWPIQKHIVVRNVKEQEMQ